MSETNVCKIGYHWTCINMYGYVCDMYVIWEYHKNELNELRP